MVLLPDAQNRVHVYYVLLGQAFIDSLDRVRIGVPAIREGRELLAGRGLWGATIESIGRSQDVLLVGGQLSPAAFGTDGLLRALRHQALSGGAARLLLAEAPTGSGIDGVVMRAELKRLLNDGVLVRVSGDREGLELLGWTASALHGTERVLIGPRGDLALDVATLHPRWLHDRSVVRAKRETAELEAQSLQQLWDAAEALALAAQPAQGTVLEIVAGKEGTPAALLNGWLAAVAGRSLSEWPAVRAARYSDVYVGRNPSALWVLAALLDQLPFAPEGIVTVHTSTRGLDACAAPCSTAAEKFGQEVFQRSAPRELCPTDVARAGEYLAGTPRQRIPGARLEWKATESELPHARTLTLEFEGGATLHLRFDRGLHLVKPSRETAAWVRGRSTASYIAAWGAL